MTKCACYFFFIHFVICNWNAYLWYWYSNGLSVVNVKMANSNSMETIGMQNILKIASVQVVFKCKKLLSFHLFTSSNAITFSTWKIWFYGFSLFFFKFAMVKPCACVFSLCAHTQSTQHTNFVFNQTLNMFINFRSAWMFNENGRCVICFI